MKRTEIHSRAQTREYETGDFDAEREEIVKNLPQTD